jgi:hypothetical protein
VTFLDDASQKNDEEKCSSKRDNEGTVRSVATYMGSSTSQTCFPVTSSVRKTLRSFKIFNCDEMCLPLNTAY